MDNNIYSDFAYDDAFRTIETYCDDVLIAFINYFFNENYTGKAKIVRLRNEHFSMHEDHSENKSITDSHVAVSENGRIAKYHIECESGLYDDSLLVKMFKYDSQIAIDSSRYDNGKLYIVLPYSGLLLLRGGLKTPSNATAVIKTPNGEVEYNIPIIKICDYSVEDLFDKKLYYLLPFFIFNLERNLESYNEDTERLEELAQKYREMLNKLEVQVNEGRLSSFSNGVIISLIHSVFYKIAYKHERVRERMDDVMGGKVMELDFVKKYFEAQNAGMEAGLAEGRAKEHDSDVEKLALHYMKEDPSLSHEDAIARANAILR